MQDAPLWVKSGYSFLEEMVWRVHHAGFRIAEIPIVFEDRTHGVPTSGISGLPYGIDFGDGVPRHPVRLLEIAFLPLAVAGFLLKKGFRFCVLFHHDLRLAPPLAEAIE